MRRLLLLCVCLLLTVPSCKGLGDLLRQYGYTEIKPASRLFGPGTIVWMQNTEPFTAGVICSADKALGDDFVPTMSPTISMELQRAAKKGVTLTADLADLVSGNVDLHMIKDIKMTLKNARLLELSDWDVANRLNVADQRCLRAVSRRKRAGFTVTMISSALQADVVYSIAWNNAAKMDVTGKISVLENLAVQLGLEASTVSDKTISANGLFWGVRDDQFLAWLFDPAHIAQVDRGSRAFKIEDLPHVIPNKVDTALPETPTSEVWPAEQ